MDRILAAQFFVSVLLFILFILTGSFSYGIAHDGESGNHGPTIYMDELEPHEQDIINQSIQTGEQQRVDSFSLIDESPRPAGFTILDGENESYYFTTSHIFDHQLLPISIPTFLLIMIYLVYQPSLMILLLVYINAV